MAAVYFLRNCFSVRRETVDVAGEGILCYVVEAQYPVTNAFTGVTVPERATPRCWIDTGRYVMLRERYDLGGKDALSKQGVKVRYINTLGGVNNFV